jgi:hypothetical protein
MYANAMGYENVYYANRAMAYARQYCPDIPVPEPKAWYRNKIHHYVTEWVEGNQLHEMVFTYPRLYSDGTTVSNLPHKLVSSLAQFVYNLTSCPIPLDKCKGPFDH